MTRRKQKHDMLVNFYSNLKDKKKKRSAPANRKGIKHLLMSIWIF
jgi:hypothetical protein